MSLRVRLTRKLAARIDGIDLKDAEVGDVLDIPLHDANLLIAEGWAVAPAERRQHSSKRVPAICPDWHGENRRRR